VSLLLLFRPQTGVGVPADDAIPDVLVRVSLVQCVRVPASVSSASVTVPRSVRLWVEDTV
jgi:hypothetical protein